MVTSGGEVSFVGRDAEAVDLRIRVRDGAGADSREGFPKAMLSMYESEDYTELKLPNSVIVARCDEESVQDNDEVAEDPTGT